MKEIVADKNLVAYCGLYCGACRRYLSDKCPGCGKNEKATWCAIRKCNSENSRSSCAECGEFPDVNACKKFNNPVSRVFGFIFRSNRKACVERIKTVGREQFAGELAALKKHSLPR
jgi:hypothetical protein